jgi:hypothetical protein
MRLPAAVPAPVLSLSKSLPQTLIAFPAARGHSPNSCEISLDMCVLAEGSSDDLPNCNAKDSAAGVRTPPSVQREKFVPVGGASLFHALNGIPPQGELLAMLRGATGCWNRLTSIPASRPQSLMVVRSTDPVKLLAATLTHKMSEIPADRSDGRPACHEFKWKSTGCRLSPQ